MYGAITRVCGFFTSMLSSLYLTWLHYSVILALNDADTMRWWIKPNPAATESSWPLDKKRFCVWSTGCLIWPKAITTLPIIDSCSNPSEVNRRLLCVSSVSLSVSVCWALQFLWYISSLLSVLHSTEFNRQTPSMSLVAVSCSLYQLYVIPLLDCWLGRYGFPTLCLSVCAWGKIPWKTKQGCTSLKLQCTVELQANLGYCDRAIARDRAAFSSPQVASLNPQPGINLAKWLLATRGPSESRSNTETYHFALRALQITAVF